MIEKNRPTLFLVLFCAMAIAFENDCRSARAQSDSIVHISKPKRPFYFWIDAGAGFSKDIASLGPPTASPGAEYHNGGVVGLVRVRGSQSRFISIGFETGWQQFSSVTQANALSPGFPSTTIKGSLGAIPVMGEVTIQDYHLQLHGGVGFYRLISTVTLYGNTIRSGEWDMAFTVGVSGQIPLWDDFNLLPELRYTRVNDIARSFLAFMLRIEIPKWNPF